MEEKTLNAQQSIELISRMITTTRTRLERNTGRPFLIWGYTTVAISLFNYLVRTTDMSPNWSLTWFLIPVVGCLLMRLLPERKDTEPRTEIDRIISKIWLVASLSLIPIFVFSLYHGLAYRADLLALITLVMALATAMTGLIVRSKIYTIAGFVGMALSTLFAFWDNFLKLSITPELAQLARECSTSLSQLIYLPNLIFAAIFLVMMVIPGHIINYQNRKRCSKS